MDWQLAITINVMALSAFSIVFSLMRWRMADVPWLVIHALILVIGAAGLWMEFAHTGTVLAAIFVPFVLLPGYLVVRGNRATARGDYATAARYMSAAAGLHPSRKMRFNAAVTRAYVGSDADSVAQALLRLKDRASDAQKVFLDVTAARMQSRWADVLSLASGLSRRQPELAEFEVRALGELGRVDEMVQVYHDIKPALFGDAVRNCQMFVLAFCGRPDAVALAGTSKKVGMHPEFVAYWQAVALAHAPRTREEGRFRLRELAESAVLPNVRQGAQYALAAAMRPAAELAPETVAQADALAQRWAENAPLHQASVLRSPLTLLLLIANGLMFAAECVLGGPEDMATLYKLGALWLGSLADPSDWWRVGAAMFLHYGWAHLILNMFSLAMLGRLVEASYGTRRMAVIYALGGLCSMAAVVALMQVQIIQPSFLVGASGAIMALIGAWTARAVQQYRRTRDALDKRSASALAVVMLGQFALDLSVPQVSFTAHATGFIIGLALGLLLKRNGAAAN